MSLLQSMVVGACATSLIIHAVVGARWFRVPQRVPSSTLAVTACFLLAGTANLVVLANKQPHPILSIVAILLYAAFQALFFAALKANRKCPLSVVFAPDNPLHIVQSGPYRHVRHPFYAAYCGTWVAGAVGSASLLLAGVALGMFLLYWTAARFEERKFQRGPLAFQYAVCSHQAGMFLPRFSRSSHERGR